VRCAACHSKMIKKRGEVDFRIEGKLFLARNVSYEECLSCGERVLTPEVSQDLFDKIRNQEFVEENVKISVLDGTYG
jgi:YgiT-type zinc finger domain-containing protein